MGATDAPKGVMIRHGVRLPLASLLERTSAAALALAAEELLLDELVRELAAAR